MIYPFALYVLSSVRPLVNNRVKRFERREVHKTRPATTTDANDE